MPRTKTTTTKKTRASAANHGTNEDSDAELSLEELKALPLETLRLKCQHLRRLTTGNRKALAERVYGHYHPIRIDPPPHIDIGDDDTLPYDETPPADEPADLEDHGEQSSDEGGNEGDNTRKNAGPTPNPDDEASAARNSTVNQVNIHEVVQAVVEKTIGEQINTMGAELGALRSLLASKNVTQKTQSTPTFVNSPTAPTATRTSPRKRKADDVNNSAKRSRQTTTTTTTRTTANSSSSSTNNNSKFNYSFPITFTTGNQPSDTVSTTKNRFRLPPIDKKFLDAIEKGEYVDFEKMKKKKTDIKSREANRTDYDLKVNEGSNDTTLSLKKSKRDTISNFNDWMAVWNYFLQARLHFKPDEAYQLFKYQQHITDFSKLYKFEAVKAYDIDFRYLIANQNADHRDDWTAFWDIQNSELKNLHLVDNPKPPPQCYNCSEKGHVSSDCPKPSKKSNKNNSGSNSNTFAHYNYSQSASAYPTYYPPPTPPNVPPPQQKHNTNPSTPATLDTNDTSNYCRALNATGVCPRGFRCKWLHICNWCRKPQHGGAVCPERQPNQTSTVFRGQNQGP